MTTVRPVVLIVDDKRNMVRLMSKVLRDDAITLTAYTGAEAIEQLSVQAVDVVLSDLKMPDMTGLDVLQACKRMRPTARFVLMTAYASVDTAVEALRLGVHDYLTKPFDPERAREVILRAVGRAPVTPGESHEVLPGIIGRSPAMIELGELVRRVANSTATALIMGETGTGKERIARAIHHLSPRRSRRFVAVNCAAIPAELLESELFGHARGAFTGAAGNRAGLFEDAHQGTLFLDEIGEMRPALQAKLTRALEERAVRRVGDTRERPVDARIVAATHRDLEAMVATEAFRQDLWYRLNVAVIRVPPVRDRREDIELLAAAFLEEISATLPDRSIVGFTPDALDALVSYDWPGNVRQLRAALERACIVARGDRLDIGDLPPELRAIEHPTIGAVDTNLTWAEATARGRQVIGRQYLEGILDRFAGNVVDAANHAGVERESFYRLMRRFDIDPDRFRE